MVIEFDCQIGFAYPVSNLALKCAAIQHLQYQLILENEGAREVTLPDSTLIRQSGLPLISGQGHSTVLLTSLYLTVN